jgi:hypothetical protein
MEKEKEFFVFKSCSICGMETKFDAIATISNWIDGKEDAILCPNCKNKTDKILALGFLNKKGE